ncbi:MAG: lipopolysaccharide transport system permease protein [Acidimicrobiaceae bacterium]|jgi:lipopolysaccharide transport system permease protein
MTKPLHVVRVDPPGRWHLPSVSELWAYRELMLLLAWRDIKVRYKQTALGAAWAILQPLLTMIVFTLIFGRLGGIPSDNVPYALFSLAGLVAWTFFANGLLLGGTSLVTDVTLVTKVYFPRIFIPFAMMVAGLVDLAIALVVLLAMVFVYGRTPSPRIVLLPLLIVMLIVSTLGITLLLSALNVRYRDVRYVIPFMTQLWLFATPVAYSTTLLDGSWRWVAALNPMAGVVQGFRWAIIGTNINIGPLIAVSGASATVLLIVGLGYFAKVERTFADVV